MDGIEPLAAGVHGHGGLQGCLAQKPKPNHFSGGRPDGNGSVRSKLGKEKGSLLVPTRTSTLPSLVTSAYPTDQLKSLPHLVV